MAFIIILVAAVVILALALVYAVSAASTRQRALPPPPGVDASSFRNHQQMARALDRLVTDDFTSGVIPEGQKREIRALLADFYGDPQIERGT